MLGNYLKEQRLKAGLSIKEISRGTRIRSEYLKALEEEQFSKIPGEVYIKGYINEYLRFLGIDPKEALELYKKARQINMPKEPPLPPPKRKLPVRYLYLAITLLLVIPAIYLITPREKGIDEKIAINLADSDTAPFKEEINKIENVFDNQELIQMIKPVVKTAEADYKNTHILRVEATAESWILIKIDNDITYSMVMKPGEVKTWSAEKGFYLKTGNAGGIDIRYDNIELGSPGKPGAVVSLNLPEDIDKFKKD